MLYLLNRTLHLDALHFELDLGEGPGNLSRHNVEEVQDLLFPCVADGDFVDLLGVSPVEHSHPFGFYDVDGAVDLGLVVVHLHGAAHKSQ